MNSSKSKESVFPISEWAICESAFDLENNTLNETLFALANGYIGTRGTFEEGVSGNPSSCEGTYLNGVYVREKIFYEESAYGFATHNNKMVQVPNGKAIKVTVDNEELILGDSKVNDYNRTVDFRKGVLERSLVWETKSGKILNIETRRLVSLADKHLICLEYKITAVNFSGVIQLESSLDAAYGEQLEWDEGDPRIAFLSIKDGLELQESSSNDGKSSFVHKVVGGDFVVNSSAVNVVKEGDASIKETVISDDNIKVFYDLNLIQSEESTLHKYIAYYDGVVSDKDSLAALSAKLLSEAVENGFEYYVDAQSSKLAEFWKNSDISFSGDPSLQQGMRFNIFHIYQSAGKDGKRNITAKGLTGPGYDGHYFWDTEIYIIPFFVYSSPDIARSLLEFRYSILDSSRNRARDMSHEKGALYSWRTIGGEECSSYFPAGTAQYHINAAIAYAIRQYFEATEDWEFMLESGAEMLFETARIWAGIGHFSDHKEGKFCINEVTGPDEYSALVDNNLYTNAMARMHMSFAANIAMKMQQDYSDVYSKLSSVIDLSDNEIELWQAASNNMYFPYDNRLKINPQDDSFLGKPVWDFENTPKDKYPLLLNFHPLIIYRHQVLKQADVILAMVLLGEEFSDDLKLNNLEYYTPLTTHDSTLSTSIYSIACSEVKKYDEAYELFGDSARMDLDNKHHNTEYGLHTACMAGSWMSIVMGFGGMRVRNGELSFAPHIPKKWNGYSFSTLFKGSLVSVSVTPEFVTYSLLEGGDITITHNNCEKVMLALSAPVKIDNL